jgi:hypothetical protein
MDYIEATKFDAFVKAAGEPSRNRAIQARHDKTLQAFNFDSLKFIFFWLASMGVGYHDWLGA